MPKKITSNPQVINKNDYKGESKCSKGSVMPAETRILSGLGMPSPYPTMRLEAIREL